MVAGASYATLRQRRRATEPTGWISGKSPSLPAEIIEGTGSLDR